MGSMFWGESLPIEIEALEDGIAAGVGWLTVDDEEDSTLIPFISISRELSPGYSEVWTASAPFRSIFEAWMTASSLAICALRLSLLSRAASCRSSRLCSVHLFPLEEQLSQTVESLANMHRIFRILHS